MRNAPERPTLRKRYERRREDLIHQSARVFAVRGYDQTSVQELADNLGFAAGSIYHYFHGKQELLIAICDQLMEPLLDEARALMDDDLAADQYLPELVRLWVAHVAHHADHLLVFQQQRHAIERGPEWKAIRASRKAFELLLDDALQRAEVVGATRYDDRRLAAAALLGMVNHTAQWYRPNGRLTPKEIADGFVHLLVR